MNSTAVNTTYVILVKIMKILSSPFTCWDHRLLNPCCVVSTKTFSNIIFSIMVLLGVPIKSVHLLVSLTHPVSSLLLPVLFVLSLLDIPLASPTSLPANPF
jgi:hypothetical protein